MPVNPDFRDLFSALNVAEARYLLIGGYAVSYYVAPRFTKYLDIWVGSQPDDAAAVHAALAAFGAPADVIDRRSLEQPGMIFQIGVPPNRIDLVTSIEGVAFEDAWRERVNTTYGDVSIFVISRSHLIQNKRACGRPQDLVDADLLERV